MFLTAATFLDLARQPTLGYLLTYELLSFRNDEPKGRIAVVSSAPLQRMAIAPNAKEGGSEYVDNGT